MEYIFRENEITLIQRQQWLAETSRSRLTLIYGPRRCGKSELAAGALSKVPYIYVTAGGKVPTLAIDEAKRHCYQRVGIEMPESLSTISGFFDVIIGESWTKPLVLVLDEFQEYWKTDKEFCLHLAKKWKAEKAKTNLNLVIICSNQEIIDELFFKQGAPLANQVDEAVEIKPLTITELKDALRSVNLSYTPIDLLALYCTTGGRPGAVRHLFYKGAFTAEAMLELFCSGKDDITHRTETYLYQVLGKNSDTYLSILQLIASGVRTQAEMEFRLGGMIIGGHLAKMENEYELIRKMRPTPCEADSRGVVRYEISDPSVKLWILSNYANRAARFTKENPAFSFPDDFRTELRDLFLARLETEESIASAGTWWRPVARLHKRAQAAPVKSPEERDVDIVAQIRGSKTVILAAVEPSADKFKKEPFLKAVELLRNGSLKGKTLDVRLFTPDDL